MKKVNIFILNNEQILKTNPLIKNKNDIVYIVININKLLIKEIINYINNIRHIINYYNDINEYNIIFENKNDIQTNNIIIIKLNDLLYNYYPNHKKINLHNINSNFMDELTKYKNIVIDPNKNPYTYLEYVKKNTPINYNCNITELSDNVKIFPLTRSVGMGSNYKSYFVHINPKNSNPEYNDIFLVGKSITYDAGGLNLKLKHMDQMKTDMTGSAIILSVLRLLSNDIKLNIHLLIPIVENMISSKATKPGSVIKSMNGKLVEITDTDAEGRLCIADCIDWINLKLIKNKEKSLIIDVATLTGNVASITSGVASIVMSNDLGRPYVDKLINIGENIGEYLDYLKIRDEYTTMLKSPVADIKNINLDIRAGCIIGGTFIHYFTDPKVPWIHIDLGCVTFINFLPLSYGINLLYEFLNKLV